MRILGIDEAGRGCVLGPLVVGAFAMDAPEGQGAADARLRDLGVDDSKRLSAAKRTRIRATLDPVGLPAVRAISPAAIDDGNLNTLEEAAIVELVVAARPDHVIMDALGHPRTLPAVQDRLAAAVAAHGLAPTWHIAPKADRDHPVCGAASIVAKTFRDGALDALRDTWGALGSGYPSDPVTRRWLSDRWASGQGWPDFVRTRWGTIRDLEEALPYPMG